MKMFRTLCTLVTLIALAISALWVKQTFYSDKTKIALDTPSVEKIQSLSALVTHKVYLNLYIEGSNEDYAGIWEVKGDALTSIDLTNIRLTDIDTENKTATLHLPPPQILSPRVDQESTRLVSIKGKGLPLLRKFKNKSVLLEEVMQQSQQKIAEVATQPHILDNARKEAAERLNALYNIVGWTLHIEWTDQSSPKPPQE